MKVFLTVLTASLFSLGFTAGGWAQETPTVESTEAATVEVTPVVTPALHRQHKKKAAPVATLSATEVPSVSPTATVDSQAKAADYQFNALVITGTKTKQKILDSPAQVEVISQKDIQNKDVGYFDDALTTVSGVEVSRNASGGQSVTVIQRGIPGYDNNLVTLDGFPFNQPYNDRVFWNRIPTPLVDQVEVAEGPFSALYGRSAVGGVINIITKEPVGEEFNFSENWDSTNQRTTDIDYQKRIDKNFAVFFGVENTSVAGYTDKQYVQAVPLTASQAATAVVAGTLSGAQQTTTTTGTTVYNLGLAAPSVLENNNLSAKFYWTPDQDESLSLFVNLSFWSQPTDNTQGEIGTSFLANSTTPTQTNLPANGIYALAGTGQLATVTQNLFLTTLGENSFGGAYLQYKLNFNKDLNLTTNVAFTDGPRLISESALSATSSTAFGGPVTGQNFLVNWEEYADAQIDWKLDNHRVVAGLSVDDSQSGYSEATFANWTNLYNYNVVPNTNSGLNDLLLGAYVQDQWKLFPSLTAIYGARLDYWEPTNIQVYSLNLGQSTTYNENSFLSFNPKVSLVFKIDDYGSLRASVGTAFNPPTPQSLTTGSTSLTSIVISNPNLVPAQDLGSEVGGEYQFPTGTTLSATVFDNYISNLVYENSVINGTVTTSEYENAGVADIQGFDAEIKQKIFSFLKVYGNTTVINSRFISDSAQASAVGKQVPFVSPVIFNIGADIAFDRWTLSLWDTYHAAEFQTANNVDTIQGVQGSYDPYSTFNLKVGYKVDSNINFSAGVNNVFNVQYYTFYLNPGTVFNFGGKISLF